MNQNYQVIDALLEKVQAGSRDAEETLLLTFKPLILSMAGRYREGPSDLEDAFQDGCIAFIKIIRQMVLGKDARPAGYIRTGLMLYYRKRLEGRFQKSVKASISVDESPLEEETGQGLQLKDTTCDIAGAYEKRMTRARLQKAIETLPMRQRKTIHALYFEEKTMAQIAREWEISPTSVREARNGALKKLKKLWEDPSFPGEIRL